MADEQVRIRNGVIMTSRTRIVLDPEVRQRLQARADDLGISVAEYVRQLIEQDLGKSARRADPSDLFDLGDSRGTDIATDKDTVIGEAIAAELSLPCSEQVI
ncbi:MAG: hypothetical protein MI824_12890 [Hyphomicrobiales bacterium]|nr:hypothetical protein [Hyphomicrobiales bacterium]